jgi:hypothetical protein
MKVETLTLNDKRMHLSYYSFDGMIIGAKRIILLREYVTNKSCKL